MEIWPIQSWHGPAPHAALIRPPLSVAGATSVPTLTRRLPIAARAPVRELAISQLCRSS